MMKKKIISVLLCVAMTAGLVVGCAGSGDSDGEKKEEKKESTEGAIELKEDEGSELVLGDYEPEKKE